jgi:hypothetical protein
LPERGHRDRERSQPEVEVLAEAPRPDLGGEVAVGDGDEAEVRPQRPRPAHALEGALLQDAQEPHLVLRRQLTDLVSPRTGRAHAAWFD